MRTYLATVTHNGRDAAWVRGWIDYAEQHAENPSGYAARMIEGNKELPRPVTPKPTSSGDPYDVRLTPERKAAIDAAYAAEYERTRQATSLDGYRHASTITKEEEDAAGLTALREKLKAEKDRAPVPKPRPTPEEEEARKAGMAQAKRELAELAKKKAMP